MQSPASDLDVLSLQLQLSELGEMRMKRESEGERVRAQLITSSKAAETLEKMPTEFSCNLPSAQPAVPPKPPPKPQCKKTEQVSAQLINSLSAVLSPEPCINKIQRYGP